MADANALAVVMVGAVSGSVPGPVLFAVYPSRVEWFQQSEGSQCRWLAPLPWTLAPGGMLAHPILHAAWNNGDPLEIAGIDTGGGLRLSRVGPGTSDTPKTTSYAAPDGERFLAFARIHGDYLAGVTRKAVHWLGWARRPPTPVALTNPVAAFVLPSDDLLLVEADCTLMRVPIPPLAG